jgi:hypothetical protein
MQKIPFDNGIFDSQALFVLKTACPNTFLDHFASKTMLGLRFLVEDTAPGCLHA